MKSRDFRIFKRLLNRLLEYVLAILSFIGFLTKDAMLAIPTGLVLAIIAYYSVTIEMTSEAIDELQNIIEELKEEEENKN